MAKRTEEAAKLAGLIGRKTGAPIEGSAAGDLVALINALNAHKVSNDHDSFAHVWTAFNRFTQAIEVANIYPVEAELSDIGSPTRLFRKGFFSELSTVIFKKENVLVMDGTFVLTKQSGKFEDDVLATDTQIDFGQMMIEGDFVLLRSEGQAEYLQVGSQVEGSVYNVTRNLDGSGANNWAAGSVYFVRGQEGDGWIELTATDDQRLSIFIQGANWNEAKEVVRLGKLNDWQGGELEGFGIAIGDLSSKRYISYSSATGEWVLSGGKMIAGGGNVVIDDDGIDILRNFNALRFFDDVGKLVGKVQTALGKWDEEAEEQTYLNMIMGEPSDVIDFDSGSWVEINGLPLEVLPVTPPYMTVELDEYRAAGIRSGEFFPLTARGNYFRSEGWYQCFPPTDHMLGLEWGIEYYGASKNYLGKQSFAEVSKFIYYDRFPSGYDIGSIVAAEIPVGTTQAKIYINASTLDLSITHMSFFGLALGFSNKQASFELYPDKAIIKADEGLDVQGKLAASNVRVDAQENSIPITAADKTTLSAGWIPQLDELVGTAPNSAQLNGLDSTAFVQAAGLGTWQSWTPTITYAGGSTDPTSTTLEHARYCQIGNAVSFSLVASIVRGSGNRTVVFVTLPVTAKYSQITAACSENIVTTTNTPRACWADNTSRMVVTLASAMAHDGQIRISGTYEV